MVRRTLATALLVTMCAGMPVSAKETPEEFEMRIRAELRAARG